MKKIAVFAALLCALASLAFSKPLPPKQERRGNQTLLEPGHWLYDALQILEQERAIVQFSDQAPINLDQVRAMLFEIDYDKLSEAGKIQYDRIIGFFNESRFSVNASIFQARIEPSINLEGYVKTNENVMWFYDAYKKKRFIDLPVTVGVGDWATFYADIFLGINKTTRQSDSTNINVPYSESTLAVNFPYGAYGSIGYAFTDTVGFNFRVSNMAQSFGRADTGSVLQSDVISESTNAALTVYSPIAQYTCGLTQWNTRRYVYSHKLDARIAKKFQISLMEAALPYGNIDLRFFNPMMFLHSYTSWLDYQADGSDVGSFFGAKISGAPCKYLRVFALWSMTQFQLPVELDDDDTNKDNYVPNAMGFQAGLESYIPIKKGHLHLNLEGCYAQPYLFINSSPNWSFVKTSAESNSGSSEFYEWLGTRYGPDTLAASFKAEYEVPEKWSAGFKYLFLARGEFSETGIFKNVGWGPRILDMSDTALKDWVYPWTVLSDKSVYFNPKYRDGRNFVAPTGIPEYVNVLCFYGSYNVTRWFKVMAQPALAIVANAGHIQGNTEVSFECVLGAQFKFTKLKKDKKILEEKDVVEATESE